MKNVLIPYSGGLDSTYLTWKNLKEGNNVTVVYFEIENNRDKVILERIHRQKIIDVFHREFGYDKPKTCYMDYKISVNNIQNDYGLIQAPIWILGAFMGSKQEYDEIQMGYVMNDDAVSYLKEIEDLFKAFQPFSQKPLPKITFPIIKKHKTEMLRELPFGLKKYVYCCENPRILDNNKKEIVYKYCSDCVPCSKINKIIEHDYQLSDNGFIFSKEIERTYNKHSNTIFIKTPEGEINLDVLTEEDTKKLSNSDSKCSLSECTREVAGTTLEKMMNQITDFTVFNREESNGLFAYKIKPEPTYTQLELFDNKSMEYFRKDIELGYEPGEICLKAEIN